MNKTLIPTLAEFKNSKYPFEDYLKTVHYTLNYTTRLIWRNVPKDTAMDYHGTDDDMPDAFDDWLGSLDGEDYITHGNALAKLLLDLIKE